MDCSSPGSSAHGILQASVLEWVAKTFSRASFLVAQVVKNLPAMQETRVRSLGQEDHLEKGMTTHSSMIAWRIPWTEECGRLQSMGLKESNRTKRLTLYRPTHKTSSAHLHKWPTLRPPNQLPRLPCEAAAVVHSDANEIKTKTKKCTEGFRRMLCLLTITHKFGFFFPKLY